MMTSYLLLAVSDSFSSFLKIQGINFTTEKQYLNLNNTYIQGYIVFSIEDTKNKSDVLKQFFKTRKVFYLEKKEALSA